MGITKLCALYVKYSDPLKSLCSLLNQSPSVAEINANSLEGERKMTFEKARVIEYPKGYQPREGDVIEMTQEIPMGHFPALRNKLRNTLDGIYLSTEETANELIRTAALEKEFMDDMLRRAQQNLHTTSEYFKKKMGE